MTSRQIECFLVAADKLNFTTASEILFLSQSNMSRNISSLEEELGMKLFERQKNKVLLTEQGVIMYEAFNQMNKYISALLSYEASVPVPVHNLQAVCGSVRSVLILLPDRSCLSCNPPERSLLLL